MSIWTDEDAQFNSALCKRIAAARRARGLSQVDLAAAAGISYATVASVEQGQYRVGLNLLQRFADGLGLAATRLLRSNGGGEGSRSCQGPPTLPKSSPSL